MGGGEGVAVGEAPALSVAVGEGVGEGEGEGVAGALGVGEGEAGALGVGVPLGLALGVPVPEAALPAVTVTCSAVYEAWEATPKARSVSAAPGAAPAGAVQAAEAMDLPLLLVCVTAEVPAEQS